MTNNIAPLATKKPLVVYFRKNWSNLISSGTERSATTLPEFDLIFVDTWDELFDAIIIPPDQIIFHADILTDAECSVTQIIGMINTATSLLISASPAQLSIGVDNTTTQEEIKEFKQVQLRGIVPSISSFGFAEAKLAVLAILSGLTYWPDHIISKLPVGHKPIVSKNPHGFHLTPRQQEISDLIKNRGISNKHIARYLSISESTVKLHLSAILKKYNLRNRTQLAVTLANTKAQID